MTMRVDEQQHWATELARAKHRGGAGPSSSRSTADVSHEIDQKKVLLRDTISSQNLAAAQVVFDELIALRYELLLTTMREARDTQGSVSNAQFKTAIRSYHRDIRSLAAKLDTVFRIPR